MLYFCLSGGGKNAYSRALEAAQGIMSSLFLTLRLHYSIFPVSPFCPDLWNVAIKSVFL